MLGLVFAAVLAWVPVVGQALGLVTAVGALHWPVVPAVAVFLWPLWFAGSVYVVRRFTGGGRRYSDGGFQRSLQALQKRKEASGADIPPRAEAARQL